MKNYKNSIIARYRLPFVLIFLLCSIFNSCKDTFLDEVPLDRFSPEGLLIDSSGFETTIVALYAAARQGEILGGVNFDYMNLGTDICSWGRPDSRGFKDYTLLNSESPYVTAYWDWGYKA